MNILKLVDGIISMRLVPQELLAIVKKVNDYPCIVNPPNKTAGKLLLIHNSGSPGTPLIPGGHLKTIPANLARLLQLRQIVLLSSLRMF
ncbi:MAG: hypothetical protein C4517_17495 [Stygiobacter sp.]|nr:MAG: hypothetical protein C4517_17495 [Stygiobacter sp.]